MHLCDVLACQLPAEKWWENGSGSQRSSGNGSSGGKGLPRSNSSRGRASRQEAAVVAEAPDADLQEYGGD